ncbi:hypothetical protein Scep_004625 [Stephania cephalantha]|uniref:Uncharacterized protein n=1 Tax=Stephania cephalantha TaxID=152367 RepID=A0AAP0PZA3_9MAGN
MMWDYAYAQSMARVLIRYGKFPNSTLLLDFGFTLPYNAHDQALAFNKILIGHDMISPTSSCLFDGANLTHAYCSYLDVRTIPMLYILLFDGKWPGIFSLVSYESSIMHLLG